MWCQFFILFQIVNSFNKETVNNVDGLHHSQYLFCIIKSDTKQVDCSTASIGKKH